MIDDRTRTAWHEAGHATLAFLCGYALELASIRPSDAHGGVVIYSGEGSRVSDFEGVRARRGNTSYLARLGMNPTPLFPADLRRRAEVGIMISLAGPLAEELAGPRENGYRPESPDEVQALATAVEYVQLSEVEVQRLELSERTPKPTDEENALTDAGALTPNQFEAIAYVNWLRQVTRNIVFTEAFAGLVEMLVKPLLEHEVLAGEHVTAILAKATGERRPMRLVASRKP